jgi:hypothetical protein
MKTKLSTIYEHEHENEKYFIIICQEYNYLINLCITFFKNSFYNFNKNYKTSMKL